MPAAIYAHLTSQDIERQARVIRPGEWAVEDTRPIATLLGSCVAVCLFDSGIPVGGMNHFMLPKMNSGKHAEEDMLLAGDACMEALLNALLNRGAAKHRIQAKAFGGGTVIESNKQLLTIGRRNVEFAQQWLERERIPLVASNFLGPWARKILFLPENGDAYCKRMTSNQISPESIRREEEAYRQTQTPPPAASTKKIELF